MYFSTFNSYDDNLYDFSNTTELCLVCWENEGNCYTLTHFKHIYKYETECKCNGVFHGSCIEKWLNINKSCPICREEIIHINISSLIIRKTRFVVNIFRRIFLFFQLCMMGIFINCIVIFYSRDYSNQ